MGPTSELFRKLGSEEEDPLQLPRSVINRSDITLSSEELALDEYQLQQVLTGNVRKNWGALQVTMELDSYCDRPSQNRGSHTPELCRDKVVEVYYEFTFA
ncbi:hypothetical protein MRX96_020255 [Rhipicephalus microplus]